MAINFTKQEAEQLNEEIQEILFPKQEGNKKIMCATFPSNGVYVMVGLLRHIMAQKTNCVDVEDYFNEMSMKNYYDLKATFCRYANERRQEE